MLGLLIVAFGVLASAAVRLGGRGGSVERDVQRGEAAVWGMVLTALCAAIGAEALSIPRTLRTAPVVAWWGLPCVLVLGILWARRGALRGARRGPGRVDRVAAALWGATALVLLTTFLGAALTLPNTWDAWTYHLPRQVHWAQNGSVAHFGAADRRQLEMPPLAEYIGVHWMILSGSDAWANLVQWFALLGCALASACVARRMGAGPRGRALAALLVVTIPAAAMQAMNAKNDVVVAFLALALVLAGMRVCRTPASGRSWPRVALTGVTLGLLLLSKGTGYLLAAPICLVVALSLVRRTGGRGLLAGAAVGAIAVGINAPHWARNVRSFGHPLALPVSRGGYDLANTSHSPAAIASTIVRNLALHTVLPSDSATRREQAVVERVLGWIGEAPSDPATTYAPAQHPFALRWTGRQDGQAPAPGHILLGVILVGCAAARPRLVREGPGWAWFLVPFAALGLFCFYLKWQPWHQRLHIPFLALLCPVGGALLARRRLWVSAAPVVALSVCVTAYALLVGDTRRLLPPRSIFQETRAESFFHNAPHMQEVMARVEAFLRETGPRVVGLDLRRSNYEYPVLRSVGRCTRARVVNLDEGEGGDAEPAADLVISSADEPGARAGLSPQEGFRPVMDIGPFMLSLPPAAASEWLNGHPFSGWSRTEGLSAGNAEREIAGTAARLWFDSRGQPAALVLEAAAGARGSVMVRLNGELVAGVAVKDAGPTLVPLAPHAGRNTLTLTRSPGPQGVRFRRLQLRPVDEAGPAAGGRSPERH
jgi:hypothetical protein